MARSYRQLLSYLRRNVGVLTPAGIGTICAQTIRAGRQSIIPLYAASILGLDVKSIGLVMGIAAAVDMSMFYPAGYLMDRFGRKYAYVPSFLLQAVGMALIPLTGSFAALLAATSLIGFGNGLGSGTMLTLGADLARRHRVRAWARFWGCGGCWAIRGIPAVRSSWARLRTCLGWFRRSSSSLQSGLRLPQPLACSCRRR